jgi:hypothetical protein
MSSLIRCEGLRLVLAFCYFTGCLLGLFSGADHKPVLPLKSKVFEIETELALTFKELCFGDRVQMVKKIICHLEHLERSGTVSYACNFKLSL